MSLQAVIIGGGYIGMEISASLANNGVKATIVFPEPYLLARCSLSPSPSRHKPMISPHEPTDHAPKPA